VVKVISVHAGCGVEFDRSLNVKARIHTASGTPSRTGAGAGWQAEVLAELSQGVIILDGSGGVVAANAAAENLLHGPVRGRLPGWLLTHPEFIRCQAGGGESKVTSREPARELHLRLVPLAAAPPYQLLELSDISEEAALRRELQDTHHVNEDLRAAQEEMLCAYEMIEISQEHARATQEEQERLSAILHQSNQELREAYQKLSRELAPRPGEKV
jgi:hypothetical protein